MLEGFEDVAFSVETVANQYAIRETISGTFCITREMSRHLSSSFVLSLRVEFLLKTDSGYPKDFLSLIPSFLGGEDPTQSL